MFFFLVFETVAEQERSPTNVCADENITISQNANNSFAEIIKETNWVRNGNSMRLLMSSIEWLFASCLQFLFCKLQFERC